ncbi:hypothetical protein [Nannocystis sp.]|uniref:hypothetical protein n=1 Tax=Nannocystis sp. TaxID=1962667 RepID=UPI00345008C3
MGYLPDRKVLGLSKLARIADVRAPTGGRRLTRQIARGDPGRAAAARRRGGD